MKTLEEHKASFRHMVETQPITGDFLDMAEILGMSRLNKLDHYAHRVQAERDVRRLGLHRVNEAVDDLTKEELKLFVQFLVEESRSRQIEIENEGAPYAKAALAVHWLRKKPGPQS